MPNCQFDWARRGFLVVCGKLGDMVRARRMSEPAQTEIHPTAIIGPDVELGAGVEVGPYCVLDGKVRIGDGCWLQHHVTVCGPTEIGSGNKFYCYGSIGQRSQDLKYAGEPTYLKIGDDNTFREFVTVNRATSAGDATVVGSGGNFLAYSPRCP